MTFHDENKVHFPYIIHIICYENIGQNNFKFYVRVNLLYYKKKAKLSIFEHFIQFADATNFRIICFVVNYF